VTHERAAGLDEIRDQREFIERLTETIAWCREVGSLSRPGTSLRTCKPTDLVSQDHQVSSVSTGRRHRLWSAGKRNLSPATDLCEGRLVAYFPGDNLSCGVAEVESQGFFDTDNIPPYDTWLWIVRNLRTRDYADGTRSEVEANYLVAWVPPDFIELASGGIAVIPEQCIEWLDTRDDAFVRSLRRMGFLT